MGDKINFTKFDKASAGLSLLGGAATGFANKRQAELESQSLQRAMDSLDTRGDLLLGALSQRGKKVAASQTAAFAASGVELSGTALDVVVETINKSEQEQLAAAMDIQMQRTQLAIKQAVADSESKFAVFKGLLGAASQYAASEVSFRARQSAFGDVLDESSTKFLDKQSKLEMEQSKKALKIQDLPTFKRKPELIA